MTFAAFCKYALLNPPPTTMLRLDGDTLCVQDEVTDGPMVCIDEAGANWAAKQLGIILEDETLEDLATLGDEVYDIIYRLMS